MGEGDITDDRLCGKKSAYRRFCCSHSTLNPYPISPSLCQPYLQVFDRGNFAVLREAEQKLGLSEILITRMPALKSFLTSSVTLAALEALNKLVINDGHSGRCLTKNWQRLAEPKKHSQFRERQFAKLGYTTSTILYHLQDYEAVLSNTKSNNQLVQACRVYLQCEFVILGLQLLSWFTYKVTLPFLNIVEQATKLDLLKILPQLHEDLAKGKMDTLSQYSVIIPLKLQNQLVKLKNTSSANFTERAAVALAVTLLLLPAFVLEDFAVFVVWGNWHNSAS